MTRSEQEAFEKWMKKKSGSREKLIMDWGTDKYLVFKNVFLAGYRAGFEAQQYEVDDGSRTD